MTATLKPERKTMSATADKLQRLTLKAMDDLDYGKASEAFQQALKCAVRDCIDRPGDKRVRKVTLQMNLVPVPEINGNTIDCDTAKGVFTVRCKNPDLETGVVDFGVRNNGDLVFNPNSPSDHRQQTMLDDEEE